MRKRTELAFDDLSDIEEGKVSKLCRNCGTNQTILMRKDSRLDNFGKIQEDTQTLIGVCRNTECFRYVDIEKVPTWIPVTARMRAV
jgi:hypothetical protein